MVDIPSAQGNSEMGLSKFKEIRSRLENAVGGQTYFEAGSNWRYPIEYNAQKIPPYFKAQEYANALKVTGTQLQTTVPFTEEDVRVMKEKEDLMDKADLDRKFFQIFRPMDDPVRLQILRKAWPEPFERMKKAIEHRADLQKEIQTKMIDDMDQDQILLRIALAERQELQALLDQPIGPKYMADDAAKATQNTANLTSFKRGLFNPYEKTRVEHTAQLTRGIKDSEAITAPAQEYARRRGAPHAQRDGQEFVGPLYGPPNVYAPSRGAYPTHENAAVGSLFA